MFSSYAVGGGTRQTYWRELGGEGGGLFASDFGSELVGEGFLYLCHDGLDGFVVEGLAFVL